MSAISYQERMRQHLSEYKIAVLGVAKNGIWRKNRREYPHVLPFENQRLNILEPYRRQFWDYFEASNIKLHSDFHHLSSSQAMCFNLFFPFIADRERDLQLLRNVFATKAPVTDARFEVVLDPTEGTNFDFYLESGKSRSLFELKLTESEFGKAKRDVAHMSKFEKVYSSQIAGKFRESFCSCDMFLEHYQLMRIVWNLGVGTDDTLFCLVPKANDSLATELQFLDDCLLESYRPRVTILFLEDVVSSLNAAIPKGSDRLKEHLRLFREKYLPDLAKNGCGSSA